MTTQPQVYKPTSKAIRARAFEPDDRFVFLGDGSIMLYGTNGELKQSDVAYSKPDSHAELTDEALPTELKASKREIAHVAQHGIKLPVKLVPR